MSYISQIVVDSTTYDIEAKALDSTLDATLIHVSNLVDGFTQSTAGVNALDAHAGKTLNDDLTTVSNDLSSLSTNVSNNYVTNTVLNSRLPYYIYSFAIGSNSTKTITVANSTTVWILYMMGANSNNGIASMRLSDSNATNFHNLHLGVGSSDVLSASWVTSTTKLTLTNSGGSTLRCIAISEKSMSM